jgi:hypothetical protein
MIGCVLATVGVIGLLKAVHRHRHGCGGGWGRRFLHHHHGGFGHHHHRGGFGGYGDDDLGPDGPGAAFADYGGRGGFGRRFFMRGVFDQLETTPAQEKVIFAAAAEFRGEASKFRGELRKSRADVAAAFRKASFDEVLLGELYARQDTAIEGLRKAFVGLGARVHDALDEKQRSRLADIIESGPGFFGRRLFRSRFNRGGFDRRGWDW